MNRSDQRWQTVVLFVAMISVIATAKIADPESILNGGVRYRSHENYVEAIDTQSGRPRWHTEVYSSIYPMFSNPFMESDVGWNIVANLEVKGDTVVVWDSKRNQYFLRKSSGEILGQIVKPESHSSLHWGALAVAILLATLVFLKRRKSRRDEAEASRDD